jgi:hypothetical protein
MTESVGYSESDRLKCQLCHVAGKGTNRGKVAVRQTVKGQGDGRRRDLSQPPGLYSHKYVIEFVFPENH